MLRRELMETREENERLRKENRACELRLEELESLNGVLEEEKHTYYGELDRCTQEIQKLKGMLRR